jgi:hypothetical protein
MPTRVVSQSGTRPVLACGRVEGAGHYGAGLSRSLAEQGETVLEAGRQTRGERRLHGKDDTLDAIRAARSGLAAETLALPRAGAHQEALRVPTVSPFSENFRRPIRPADGGDREGRAGRPA